jgi:Ca2+-binding RTX toxin-like protein
LTVPWTPDLDSDVMAGGVGDDIYYADADDTIQEGLNEGIDKIFTAQSAILPDGVENLTLTGTQDVNGTGNELDNVIFGNSGQNRLSDGSGGFDVLVGGAGDDIYRVTRGTTVIVEESGAGRDQVSASVSYVLPDFVEDASTSVLWEAIDLTGNELSNGLIGNYGNNTLSGLGGNDRLNGGPGDDTLIGGAGSDQLAGGGGIDTADYSSAPGAIFLNIDAPADDVYSTVTGAAGRDTLSLIEHIIGSSFDDVLRLYGKVMTRLDGGDGSDTVTGNSRADVLNGGSGNDIISGGAANDTLIGGAGNDTMDGGSGVDVADYSEATTRVTVDLAFSGPQNTGNGTGFDTLSNIENLTGGRLTDRLSGNGLDNVLKGLNGND